MVYQFKDGARLSGDAQTIGEHIETLRMKKGGMLTPEDIVSDAKRARSPLHSAFEWDDSTAAQQYRLVQAREVLRAIVVVHETMESSPVRAFVRVDTDEGTRFTSIQHAMSEDDLREQVLQRALRELTDWRQRYDHLKEFAKIFSVIDEAAA